VLPGTMVMNEVLTILGVTPDQNGFPERCGSGASIRAAIDPATKSVMANSEDGKLYRWNLSTNTFTESITLSPESVRPTLRR